MCRQGVEEIDRSWCDGAIYQDPLYGRPRVAQGVRLRGISLFLSKPEIISLFALNK